MRIAQVSPLTESVPPRTYGGTERVVHVLTEELVRQGHEVTLYASGDSTTSARLVAVREHSLRLDAGAEDAAAHHLRAVERVAADASGHDVIHWHLDGLQFPTMRRSPTPCVTTMHGRMDLPELVPLFREFREAALVSISDAQREPLPWLNWRATIHHGLPMGEIVPRHGSGGYLAFLGRISPEKRADRAIEIARRSGMPLRIAAKVDRLDEDYFADRIEPLLGADGVEYIGEIGEDGKDEFLGNAAALLFPIDWPEPFGLVMVEAMARGTPVLAFRHGSVPEVVEPGVTGSVVASVDEAVDAIPGLLELSRAGVRTGVERRFGAERMAQAYIEVYRRLGAGRRDDSRASRVTPALPVSDWPTHDRPASFEPEDPVQLG
jgi:glycosyltransferase involved in cell wall biosynthesis